MKSYIAAFSAPIVDTPFADGQRWLPSLYCLSGTGHGQQVMCDRYEWDPAKGKPWWGARPADTHSLYDLVGGYDLFTDGGTGNLLDAGKPVDAALCLGDVSTVYLFQGGNCITFSINRPTGSRLNTRGFTRPIAQEFGYVFDDEKGKVFPFDGVDAALYSPADNKIWFFRGAQCESFAGDNFQPDHWDPSNGNGGWGDYNPAISSTWANSPGDFSNGITWAVTSNLVTDPVTEPEGTYQDSGYLVKDTDWCPVTPSTTTANRTLFTTPGDHTFTIPADATAIIVEAWGGGGQGGEDGETLGRGGGNGGSGAYAAGLINPAPSGSVGMYIGGQGDYTCFPADNPVVCAGGGGGGGGGSYLAAGGDGGGGDGSVGNVWSGAGSNGGKGGGGGRTDGTDGSGGSNAGGGGGGQDGSKGQGGAGAYAQSGYGGGGALGGGGGGGGYVAYGGGGGGGGGKGAGGKYGGGGGGGGGGADGCGASGGGGGQGPSLYPAVGNVQERDETDARLPYNQPEPGIGEGGQGGGSGGGGAIRISWY